MKTRSSWFPAWWVGGEEENVRSKVEKRVIYHNIESERKGDGDSVEFKSRSG